MLESQHYRFSADKGKSFPGVYCAADADAHGLGERAGNAALEEVVVALKRIYGLELGIDTRRFVESQLVAKISGNSIPRCKAIVGENAFTHESGIHVDGLLKDPNTYEPFSPEDVGRQHRFVVGKHSSRHLVCNLLRENGVELGKEEAQLVLDAVRE